MRTGAVRTIGAALVVLAGAILLDTFTTRDELLGMTDEDAIEHVGVRIAGTVVFLYAAYVLVTRSGSFAGRRFAIVASVLTLVAAAQSLSSWDGGSQNAPRLTPRQKEALEYLKKTEVFQLPVVGFAAVPSAGFIAMRTVSRSGDRDAAFKDLWKNGKTAGRLYALCGLRRTDPHFFRRALSRLEGSQDSVDLASGCVIAQEPVATIVRDHRAMQLRPNESAEAWLARRNPAEYVIVDIAGGGYTSMFLDQHRSYRALEAEGSDVDFAAALAAW